MPLRPVNFLSESNRSFVTRDTRPVIPIINKTDKTAYLVEVSSPFDSHLQKCYQSKFDKYLPLSLEINDLGYYTEIIVLIVGSLGYVHTRFISGLRKLNIPRHEAAFLAKYCSISAIIGSKRVWDMRCKAANQLR